MRHLGQITRPRAADQKQFIGLPSLIGLLNQISTFITLFALIDNWRELKGEDAL